MISQALRIHETTVARHINDYLQSEKLKPENGGSQSRMPASQTTQLIEHLTEKTYFLTRQIITYVEVEFGVGYIIAGINRWLHHNDFSYKKPKGVPHKQKSDERQAFIKYYNNVLKFNDAPVLQWMPFIQLNQQKLSCGWPPKGQDKLNETLGSCTRLNLIGSLSLINISATITDTYEMIDSESIVRFFWKLKKEHYPLEQTSPLY